jgi:hypothetical protein
MTGKSLPPGSRSSLALAKELEKEALTASTPAHEVVRKPELARRKFRFVVPAKEAVRKLVQIPNCRSGTGRRAGPGTYEHLLCQCVRRPVFMVSGLPGWRPRPGMTSFFRFRDSLESGNPGTSVTCPCPPVSWGRRVESLGDWITPAGE